MSMVMIVILLDHSERIKRLFEQHGLRLPAPLHATFSKLLIYAYCLLGSTQPPTLIGTGSSSSAYISCTAGVA